MSHSIYREIGESYLNNQLVILRNLSAKVEFQFISEFATQTEEFLCKKFDTVKTKKDLVDFQNMVETLDEINGIFLRTTDESSYWAMPLIKELYKFLNISLEDREVLIVNDYKVNSTDGGFGVIVDLFNNKNIAKLAFPTINKKVDVFFLPRQSNFSVSSIAVLAHEVGHVYFGSLPDIQEEIIDEILAKLTNDGKSIDLFNNPHEKLKRTNLSSHIEEFFCDNIGQYLLGPIYNFAVIKILALTDDDDLTYLQGSHPPIFKRLYNAKANFKSFKEGVSKGPMQDALTTIDTRFFENLDLIPPLSTTLDSDELYYINLANDVAANILSKYLGKSSLFEVSDYQSAFEKCHDNLNRLIPLIETTTADKKELISPWELMVATVLYYSGNVYEKSNEYYKDSVGSTEEKREQLKRILISFNKYAVNLHSFCSKVNSPLPEKHLQKHTVWNLRERGGKSDPFIVVPTVDFDKQYSANAVDLRLGNTFITSKLTEFTHIPTKPSSNPLNNKNIEYFFEKHFIPFKKNFTLHPHNFVLAVTMEYLCIPADYYALVLGRSTWGRLGLNIATATAVGPGFKGCITLELRNLSEVPITLNVGTRICQICLIKNPQENISSGISSKYFLSKNKYICPTEVEYPKINLDPDWELLERL